ncbi:DUF1439 domain-containing protein [Luteimonas viscosa]|uniref:DUF1439 domain-containing protein n=1 Tax=Luteimonas viscosa TaxID=1132694 RepID=A0A5D4XR48_9GAMM|nr:DUF1439 domain-containing protein [Luteimonas viscosa]TYT27167.1 DUF1439 domain-containing protein [Luteimonas viscosa]
MRRLPLSRICPSLLLLVLLAGCSTIGVVSAWLGDQVAFTPGQLQRHLDHRFPRTFDKLGGLVTVTLDNPRASIAPGDSRLRLEFDLGLGALGSEGATTGHLALASGLRYDPATQGLHLDAPELLQFEIPRSGELLRGGARGIVNSLLAEYARTEPVYRLDDDLLAKLPAGSRIGEVGIERGVVVVRLER